ncbi:cathelin-like [Trichosurus vulpecula]|uniref:cathelin-like n=1 Tax=Trichosurus vulpecula TaxID=9337 RepID=UPI00186B3E72|nr:cathelin-like [Trichosurus vulpecula]
MSLEALWPKKMKGSTMQLPLLVLGLLSLMTPHAYGQDQRYQDLVNRFIQQYNKNSGSENLFRLSILDLQSGENNDPATPRLLSFTIRETVCPNTENRNPDECDFKENGVVKECVGAIALDSPNPSADISCDGPEKIKRRSLRKRLKKLGKSIVKRLKNSNIGFSIPLPG